ncbi:putative signal transduction protein with CBS domains [Halorhabdus utahensis DSM 12940]|uniref:Putative signal transduction protein with CBS domains n=1 Tax=Halorhabdus utahensis (strain DSM 12940 / JCM 11049 / AX-2) TaxID=519442 RepID=C7NUP4_HALUD|nr:CBS domain-containing protein [Halorhabdus utahensis]ACV12401.1 putative signal transduction protein with CBS domains [Halorhabdus utahensis DSM 12940]
MPVTDLARSDVVTAQPETPVTELAGRMDAEDVGSVVITDDDTPVGIVTDRDLAIRVLGKERDRTETTAADVMTADLKTIEADAGFYEATNLMSDAGIRRLPVTDGDELTGIVTADDLTELIADEEQQLASTIRAQRPAY